MKQIVLATGNPGKLRELVAMLAGTGIQVIPQTEFNVTDAEETGLSFVENAILKARNASRQTNLPAIADDSGLEVEALGGAPGIYSARYAGEDAEDADNTAKLLLALQDVPSERRRARFRCAMVYLKHSSDPAPLICEGIWEGHILEAPRGSNGFGYDPVFLVSELGCSSAELPPDEKNRLSHRGQALKKLVAVLTREPD